MIALAMIKDYRNEVSNQWQFDKIMSAIAYDVDLKVVFMPNSIKELTQNKAWKCLDLYGIEGVYFMNFNNNKNYNNLIKCQAINADFVKQLINEADIVL
ncbi:MAG: hypothetical protein AB8B80_16380 [Marinicellaceae bacterium]